jgi:hypothetical protein
MMNTSTLKRDHLPVTNPSTRKFQMALYDGAILVLATSLRDQHRQTREHLEAISLFQIDQINMATGTWTLKEPYSLPIHDRPYPRLPDPQFSLTLSHPMKVVKNDHGLCPLFTVELAYGYRLHHLDFIKAIHPEIYRQLNLN